jgi:hypothetical protein
MAECSVAIDQITDDAVHAKDEITATDLVLEGEGLEWLPRRTMPPSPRISAANHVRTLSIGRDTHEGRD